MIKIQRKIQFHNDCGALVNYEELEKAVLWYAPHPVVSNKHIYKYGEYPAVSIGKQKVHIHRLLMMYWCGYIFPSDIYVHHIDENKLNATKSNLAIIPCREHQRYHNKGKQISNYQRQRIIETNRLRKGTRRNYYKSDVSAHDVYILVKQGHSFNKISKSLDLDWSCVKQRYFDYIHDNPEMLEATQ